MYMLHKCFLGVRDDRLPGGLNKTRFRRLRIDMDDSESTENQLDLEASIQTLINCDPYISPSFVTTEGNCNSLGKIAVLTFSAK